MFIKSSKGQSILEYAVLISVVIAALLIMQTFIKRGFQGGLKDAADKMGDQFSAGGTTTKAARNMTADQLITEEVATNDTLIKDFLNDANVTGTLKKGVLSYNARTGGDQTMETMTKTESAKNEDTRLTDFENKTFTDYVVTNMTDD